MTNLKELKEEIKKEKMRLAQERKAEQKILKERRLKSELKSLRRNTPRVRRFKRITKRLGKAGQKTAEGFRKYAEFQEKQTKGTNTNTKRVVRKASVSTKRIAVPKTKKRKRVVNVTRKVKNKLPRSLNSPISSDEIFRGI